MNRTVASLALAAAAAAAPLLAGCMSTAPAGEPRVASNELPYRAGQGVVVASEQARQPISAAAGGTASAASTMPANYRLTIRMDDGTMQYVDTDNRDITVGSRVSLGADRTIRVL
jgi:hypothetical protein